jgi:hypothetical protein
MHVADDILAIEDWWPSYPCESGTAASEGKAKDHYIDGEDMFIRV